MEITWLGHACFLIDDGRTRLLTDPFDASVGYPVPCVRTDYVTISHQHHDHNAVHLLPAKPTVIESVQETEGQPFTVTCIPTFHDHHQGEKRGPNTVFVLKWDGWRICHLGDLGHPLSTDQIAAVGPLDVLCIPVGGFYTIDAVEAFETVCALKPAIILPMHYKTDYTHYPIAGVEEFTKYYSQVERLSVLRLEARVNHCTPRVVVLELTDPALL